MNFDPVRYSLILQDAVYSMTAGFITGFMYHLLSVFLYRGKIRVFIRDFITCLVFTVLLFSYCVSFANYPVLRWYNVVFALGGCVFFSPCFEVAVRLVLKLAGVTAVYFSSAAAGKIKAHTAELRRKNAEKRQKNSKKSQEEVLKQEDILLYN